MSEAAKLVRKSRYIGYKGCDLTVGAGSGPDFSLDPTVEARPGEPQKSERS